MTSELMPSIVEKPALFQDLIVRKKLEKLENSVTLLTFKKTLDNKWLKDLVMLNTNTENSNLEMMLLSLVNTQWF